MERIYVDTYYWDVYSEDYWEFLNKQISNGIVNIMDDSDGNLERELSTLEDVEAYKKHIFDNKNS